MNGGVLVRDDEDGHRRRDAVDVTAGTAVLDLEVVAPRHLRGKVLRPELPVHLGGGGLEFGTVTTQIEV